MHIVRKMSKLSTILRARPRGGCKIFYLVSSTFACDTTPPCFTGNPPLSCEASPSSATASPGTAPFCWWCSPPGVTRKVGARSALPRCPGGSSRQRARRDARGVRLRRPRRQRQPRAVVVVAPSARLRAPGSGRASSAPSAGCGHHSDKLRGGHSSGLRSRAMPLPGGRSARPSLIHGALR